tara:strand:- start:358 stop:666 length:309 start_codon:yes stop_codon:yes gene_type:complete
MNTLAVAVILPIIGLMISLKTNKTITDNQLSRIKELESQTLVQKNINIDMSNKQVGFSSLNERLIILEQSVKDLDENQARKMITLLQPVAKTLKNVQETIGI